MKISLVYMTAKDKREARRIADTLVKSRVAACANIIGGMNSIYRWEGKIERAREVVVIAKTRKSLVKKLIKKVKSIHSYSCPCIISLPISAGNKDFLDWIHKETKS